MCGFGNRKNKGMDQFNQKVAENHSTIMGG